MATLETNRVNRSSNPKSRAGKKTEPALNSTDESLYTYWLVFAQLFSDSRNRQSWLNKSYSCHPWDSCSALHIAAIWSVVQTSMVWLLCHQVYTVHLVQDSCRFYLFSCFPLAATILFGLPFNIDIAARWSMSWDPIQTHRLYTYVVVSWPQQLGLQVHPE